MVNKRSINTSDSRLPIGWVKIELKQLGQYINGRAFKPTEWKTTGLPIIRIQNLNNSAAIFNHSPLQHERKYLVKEGDLLMAWSASLGVYIWDKKDAWLNQHIFKVIPNTYLVTKRFLYYALQEAIEEFYLKSHGSGIVHITKPVFESHEIPIPPLEEQKRIVDKLDAIMDKVEGNKRRLEKIPVLLKRFRQAVLAAAVSGRLTEEWREENSGLNGKNCLKESYNERLIIYNKNLTKSKTDNQRKPSRPCDLVIIENGDFDIPQSWIVTIPELIASPVRYSLAIGPFGSNLKISDYKKSGIPLIFVRHIKSNEFIGLNPKYVSEDKAKELMPHSIEPLDLLITKMGEPPGDCEIYPENMPKAIITADCLKFQVWSKYFDRIYFKHLINSSLIREQLGIITQGVAQQKISLERFKTLHFPLPPPEEQKEIVRKIELLFSFADKIEARYAKAKAMLDKLPQTILAKAFRGELVAQDPSDESVSVLLVSINAEKESIALAKAGRKAEGQNGRKVLKTAPEKNTLKAEKSKRAKIKNGR